METMEKILNQILSGIYWRVALNRVLNLPIILDHKQIVSHLNSYTSTELCYPDQMNIHEHHLLATLEKKIKSSFLHK